MKKNNRIQYSPPKVDYGKMRKSQTIPDQSMSIQEIVKRYVRGVPVDVQQRTPVYLDQSDHDMEMLGRMDFGQKAEYAAALAEQAKQMQAELKELERSVVEQKATKAKAEEEAWKAKVRAAAKADSQESAKA